MVNFPDWCHTADSKVGTSYIRILAGDPSRLAAGVSATAAVVPSHYAAEERIATVLRRLGKPEAARFIEEKLPTSKSIRSGDLGEILATEWIASQGGYDVPIKRLRWKDHRNMAMRGDDVIGLKRDPNTGALLFLKTEAKSRVSLSAGVIGEARKGLDKDGGRPSAHALAFIADRLAELGNDALADAILDAQLKSTIPLQSVLHLTFTFSGNDPQPHLTTALQGYGGPVAQWGVGLRIDGHASFVAAVYDQVINNANS
ncbi:MULTISPECIES: Hachiman antiphage defense system protein HamA [unclassified Bradyrhizobium]|uniref:Hachiman antiphage defense system protein HamA n=1 Tax=unclassified Bradyrhizobium TaxID=2631580 RepID=UPI0028ECDB0E|nr:MULTISPECIES: Hachiman antiphage defense system protein HamA [unclassified Bradyrhizobium]